MLRDIRPRIPWPARRIFATTTLAAMICAPALGDEYFGKFLGNPVGTFLPSEDRPVFQLSKPFAFEDPNSLTWTAPGGIKVDGASIPKLLWTAIDGPFSGKFLNASIIHDYYCRAKLRTAHDTHRNFYYGMRAAGVGVVKAKAMYWAVRAFGPDWSLIKKVVSRKICDQVGDETFCANVPTEIIVPETPGSGWIGDTYAMELSSRKLLAVAKTLNTSNGAYFDISTKGPVEANLDALDRSAALVRGVLANKLYSSHPELLGVLDRTPLALAGPFLSRKWAGGVMPAYTGTKITGPSDAMIAKRGGISNGTVPVNPLIDAIAKNDQGKWHITIKPVQVDQTVWNNWKRKDTSTFLKAQKTLQLDYSEYRKQFKFTNPAVRLKPL